MDDEPPILPPINRVAMPAHQNAGMPRHGQMCPFPTKPTSALRQPGYRKHVQMNRMPQRILCPNCLTEQMTVTQSRRSRMNYLVSILLAISFLAHSYNALTFVLIPLAVLPLFMVSLKNIQHNCPNCNLLVGYWMYGGGTESTS